MNITEKEITNEPKEFYQIWGSVPVNNQTPVSVGHCNMCQRNYKKFSDTDTRCGRCWFVELWSYFKL